jgi:hypothetical protein
MVGLVSMILRQRALSIVAIFMALASYTNGRAADFDAKSFAASLSFSLMNIMTTVMMEQSSVAVGGAGGAGGAAGKVAAATAAAAAPS